MPSVSNFYDFLRFVVLIQGHSTFIIYINIQEPKKYYILVMKSFIQHNNYSKSYFTPVWPCEDDTLGSKHTIGSF